MSPCSARPCLPRRWFPAASLQFQRKHRLLLRLPVSSPSSPPSVLCFGAPESGQEAVTWHLHSGSMHSHAWNFPFSVSQWTNVTSAAARIHNGSREVNFFMISVLAGYLCFSSLRLEIQHELWGMPAERDGRFASSPPVRHEKPGWKEQVFNLTVCGCARCSVCGAYRPKNAWTTRWRASCPPAVFVHWATRDGGSAGVRRAHTLLLLLLIVAIYSLLLL